MACSFHNRRNINYIISKKINCPLNSPWIWDYIIIIHLFVRAVHVRVYKREEKLKDTTLYKHTTYIK